MLDQQVRATESFGVLKAHHHPNFAHSTATADTGVAMNDYIHVIIHGMFEQTNQFIGLLLTTPHSFIKYKVLVFYVEELKLMNFFEIVLGLGKVSGRVLQLSN